MEEQQKVEAIARRAESIHDCGTRTQKCPPCDNQLRLIREDAAALQSSLTRVEGEHERLTKQLARMTGTGCQSCGGLGRTSYANTATWRGGIGGMTITEALCNVCWGSGDSEQPFADQRQAEARLAALVSSLTRLLEGGYMQHKADCALIVDDGKCVRCCHRRGVHCDGQCAMFECECDHYEREGGPATCTCDLDTLLATLTRLARSPEEK